VETVLGDRVVAYWDHDEETDQLVATAVSDPVDLAREITAMHSQTFIHTCRELAGVTRAGQSAGRPPGAIQ
jgi:hypothetical protein